MKLTLKDRKVINYFLLEKSFDSKNLTTDGKRLDGTWMGGNGIAEWKGGKIHMKDLGSKAAQTVQKALKRAGANNLFAGYKAMPKGKEGRYSDKPAGAPWSTPTKGRYGESIREQMATLLEDCEVDDDLLEAYKSPVAAVEKFQKALLKDTPHTELATLLYHAILALHDGMTSKGGLKGKLGEPLKKAAAMLLKLRNESITEAKKPSKRSVEKSYNKLFNKMASGIEFDIMDLGDMEYDVVSAVMAGGDETTAMKAAIKKYRQS